MEQTNVQNSLQAFVRRRPFRPFAIELTSTDRFVVDHPEALAMRGAVAVYINPNGQYTLFDSTSVSQLTETIDRMSAAS